MLFLSLHCSVVDMVSPIASISCSLFHVNGDFVGGRLAMVQFREEPKGGSGYQRVGRRESRALNGNKSEWCILSSSTGAEW